MFLQNLKTLIHETKLHGFAIFNFLEVFIVAYMITSILMFARDPRFYKNISLIFLCLTITGVFVHVYYHIPTLLGYYLCMNDMESLEYYRNSKDYGSIPSSDDITLFSTENTLCGYCSTLYYIVLGL
jgi:hypothetical protein